MDFYREKIDPLDSDRVWFIDHWERMEGRKEVIKVKNSENVQFEVMSTRHGPIINEINEMVDSLEQQPVSFFWTYNMFPCKALQTAYGMAHSSSIDEFRSAISMLEAPGLNITYADKDGNIAWWAVARLIERPEHVEPKLILDGWSGQDEPLGWYPFSVNPRSENPPEGFVYSANNQPDSAYGVLHPGYYFPGLRGQRIIELLSQREKWDLVGFQEMILDDKSPQFQETGRKITSVLPDDLNELEKQAADLLNSWNGTHQLKDIGPTIYYKLINRLQENVFQDELGEENYQVYTTTLVARRTIPYLISNHSSLWWDNINTPEIETSVDIIHQSFSESIRELSNELGIDPNQWHWEQVHLLEHQHAIGKQKPFDQLFNVGTFGIAGGDEVINKMDFSKTSSPYLVKSGASMRILIDLADMENSLSIIPTGQSGHVMSPYYKDQTDLYNSGKFRKQLMNKENIISVTGKVLVLSPEISN
jgi:penicillin amidase